MKKKIALLMAVLMLALVVPVSTPAGADTPDGPTSFVRVRLSTGDTGKITITVSGTYRIVESNETFTGGKLTVTASGNRVTVAHSSRGELYSGTAATIERCDLARTAGYLTLPVAGYSRSYLGHLSVTASGSRLQVVNRVPLSHYLYGVVAYEMSDSFPLEALKAQAVAARTFARRQMAGGKHADADVCSQSACCQACLSADALQERYGAAFDAAWDKASNAVQQTQDEVLTYGGALIDAVYFSCSGGSTEAAAAVWGTDVPYLQAVDSPGEQDAAPYASTVTCSPAEFAETLGLAADGDPAGWLGGTSYTAGGGVDTCTIRGQAYAGTRLRQLFGLNSTRFSLRYADGVFRFDVRGYGHRVGMSQYGANAIARLGFDYQTILRYYYRGAKIETQKGSLV